MNIKTPLYLVLSILLIIPGTLLQGTKRRHILDFLGCSDPLITPVKQQRMRTYYIREQNEHLIKKSQLSDTDKQILLGYYATSTFDQFPHKSGMLSFSPCGHHVARACHQSEQISIWESSATKVFSTQLVTLHHHKDWVTACLFSPCGRYFASAAQDKTIVIVDAQNLEIPNTSPLIILKHQAAVTALAFSPCGTYLLSGTSNNEITMWKLTTENNVLRACHLVTRNGSENDLSMKFSFSPSGRHIAIGAKSHPSVYLFETETFCNHSTLPCITLTHPSADRNTQPTAIAFSPFTTYLAVGLSDHSVTLWNMDSVEREQVLPQSISSVSTHLDNILFPLFDVVTAQMFSDELIQFNKPRHFWCDLTNSLPGNASMPLSLSFSADNRYLAAGYFDGTALFWDLAHLNQSPHRLTPKHFDSLPVRTIAFSPKQQDLATTNMNIYSLFCLLEPDYIQTLIHLLETTPQAQREFYESNPTYHFSRLSQADQIIVRNMPNGALPPWIQKEMRWIQDHATPITEYHFDTHQNLISEQEIEYYCHLE